MLMGPTGVSMAPKQLRKQHKGLVPLLVRRVISRSDLDYNLLYFNCQKFGVALVEKLQSQSQMDR